VLIRRAVGIKANERPMNSLAPVNITGASVTRHVFNINLQDIPVGISPLSCGAFPKYRAISTDVISERPFLPWHVADSTCTLAGFDRYPEHLRRIVKQV